MTLSHTVEITDLEIPKCFVYCRIYHYCYDFYYYHILITIDPCSHTR